MTTSKTIPLSLYHDDLATGLCGDALDHEQQHGGGDKAEHNAHHDSHAA